MLDCTLTLWGRHIARACRGIACHVRGGTEGHKSHHSKFGYCEEDQTTLDMNFTFETIVCFGACALSPLIMVDKKYFGNMDSRKIETVCCEEGDIVPVESHRAIVTGKVKVTKKTSPRVIFMTFQFPDVLANLFPNDALALIAKIPEYKVCAVRVQKAS